MHRVKFLIIALLITSLFCSCRSTEEVTEEQPVEDVLKDGGKRWEASGEGLSLYEWDNIFTSPISHESQSSSINEEEIFTDSASSGSATLLDDLSFSEEKEKSDQSSLPEGSQQSVSILKEEESEEPDDLSIDGVYVLLDGSTNFDEDKEFQYSSSFNSSSVSLAEHESKFVESEKAEYSSSFNPSAVSIIEEEKEVEEKGEYTDPSVIFDIAREKQDAANEKVSSFKKFFSSYGAYFIIALMLLAFVFAFRYAFIFIFTGGGLYDQQKEKKRKKKKENKGEEKTKDENGDKEEDGQESAYCFEINLGGSALSEEEEEDFSGNEEKKEEDEEYKQKLEEAIKRDEEELEERMRKKEEVKDAKKLEDLLSKEQPEKGEESYNKLLNVREEKEENESVEDLINSYIPPRPGEENYPEVLGKK